jgi:hypothetical protein
MIMERTECRLPNARRSGGWCPVRRYDGRPNPFFRPAPSASHVFPGCEKLSQSLGMMKKSRSDHNTGAIDWAKALSGQHEVPMISPSIRAFALATALSGGVICSDCSIANAQAQFNGNWSVVIYTRRGNCDPTYRYGVSIYNGVVSGGGGASLSGRVSRSGNVQVSVSSGGSSAHGSGRLIVDRSGYGRGSGSWRGSGPNGACSGSWAASR